MSAADIRTRTRTYELLLVMQTLAVLIILWSMLPLYRAIMEHPRRQIQVLPESPVPLVAALSLFHCVYWFRIPRVPIAMFRHGLVASRFVLFLGRLSFIFGTAAPALTRQRSRRELCWPAKRGIEDVISPRGTP